MDSVVRILAIIVLGIQYAHLENTYPGEDAVVERVHVHKSAEDKRSYRGLKLSNDMRVLLISDRSTEKSFVSLVVGVGGINDLPKTQGLTNLLGGLLLGRSGHYPRFFGFNDFIANNKGFMDLPKIETHDQIFEFFLNPPRLASALRRFADIFVRPSILSSSVPIRIMDKALKFVDLDFERRSKSDTHRIQQVEKVLCRPKLAYCNLMSGSRRTLIEDIPTDGLTFDILYKRAKILHSLWYSSNIMTLAVLGKESLDRLEELVVPLFSEVVNKEKTKKLVIPFALHPWGPDQLGYKIYIIPVENVNWLHLKFPVPYVHGSYKTGPDVYVADLLTGKEPNSLNSLLLNMNLCSNLGVNYPVEAGVRFFIIECVVTEAVGVKDIDTIINLIFQYIHLIREEGVRDWLFHNIKHLRQRWFLDHTIDRTVANLAYSMQYYPTEDILSHDFLADEWDEKLIEDFVGYLKPTNMNVTIVGKNFCNNSWNYQHEKYYGTLYRMEPIPHDAIEKWTERELIPGLQLPFYNEFIPENFSLYPPDNNEQNQRYPYLLHESSKTEIWYKRDEKFEVPKLHVQLVLFSSTFHLTPDRYVLTKIFQHSLELSLKECLYPAQIAGYYWKIVFEKGQVFIQLHGYCDKLPLLLRRLLSRMTDIRKDIDEVMFKSAKEQYLKTLKDLNREDPHRQLRQKMLHILSSSWSEEDTINVGSKLEFRDMSKFLSQMYRRVFVRGLIHGNCDIQGAWYTIDTIEEHFQSSNGLLLQEFIQTRVVDVARGHSFYEETIERTSGTYAYFSLHPVNDNPCDTAKVVASIVFGHAIKKFCDRLLSDMSHTIPPKIMCQSFRTYNVQAFSIGAVSEKEPRCVDRGVELFLYDVSEILHSMRDNEFEHLKKTVEKDELKSSNLKEVSENYFYEITTGFYDFGRTEKQITLLQSMQKDELVAFFKEMLDKDSPKRRKLSVRAFPRDIKTRRRTPIHFCMRKKPSTKIEDLNEFIINSSLQPVLYYPDRPSIWK